MANPRKSSSAPGIKPLTPSTPPKKVSLVKLSLIMGGVLLAAGGGYMYQGMRLEALAAQKLAAEEAARKAALEEEERRKAEEEERLRREAAEAERRRLEEEAARKAAEEEAVEEEPEEEEEAEPEEEEPEEEEEQDGELDDVYVQPLVLIGNGSNSPENKKAYNAMVNRMIGLGEYERFASVMEEKIRAAAPELIRGDKMNYNAYRNNKMLVDAIDLCLLINKVGADSFTELLAPPESGDEDAKPNPNAGKAFMHWSLENKARPLHSLMRAFKANEGKDENMGYALRTFFTLWHRTPEKDRDKYVNLAVACSLVRPEIANSAGSVRKPDGAILSIPQVYDYFCEMDARKKLLTDIKKTSVADLLYVVDVRLPRSEFDWVQKNLKYSQAQWGDAYGSVKYVMERATHNKDLYTTYTFEELREKGGVCRDQGYFACNTAKCKGIPAVSIGGDGNMGPHAWIASMVDASTWQSTGSYGYNTGRFANPCSGRSQHESTLVSRDKKLTPEKLAPAEEGMIVSEYFSRIGCAAEARGAAKYVTSAFPHLTAAWANRLSVLTADENAMPDDATWKKINNELMQAGRKNPELLDFSAEIESGQLLKNKNAAAKKRAMDQSLKKLRRTVGDGRSDLVVEAINRQARLMVEAKDVRGLSALYKKQFKECDGKAEVFQAMLGSYMGHMEDIGADKKAWAVCAKDAESYFEKKVYTGTTSYFVLSKEVGIHKMIAEAYKQAGNDQKAAKIVKKADKRLEESKKEFEGTADD